MGELGETGTPDKNVVLAGPLARLDWSPERFAAELNATARAWRLQVPPIHPKSPRRWIVARPPATRPCVPREPWPGLVCAVLSRRLQEPITLASLGWEASARTEYVPADDGLRGPWDTRGVIAFLRDVVEVMGMDRRRFVVLTGSGLTLFAQQWMADPVRVLASVRGHRVDGAVVDDLERVADARRHMDDLLGGGEVLRAVRDDLRLVTSLLDGGRYTEQVGQRLHAVAAEFSRIAGLRAFDTNDHALAQRYFLAGLRAAHTSGDRAVGANILTCMSRQARDHESRDSVDLAEAARAGTRHLTPAMEASVHAHLAHAAARAGDRTTASRAEGRMFELSAQVDKAVEPPYIYWWSDAEAHLTAGVSALSLGQPRRAEEHYRKALSGIAPSFPRDRALILTRLAQARMQLRELDGACLAATEAGAMLRHLNSAHKLTMLAEFRKAAQPYANTPQIRTFDAKFGDLLRTTPA